MGRGLRRDVIDEENVGVYHCISRVNRQRPFLGKDSETGEDYSHRRDMIIEMITEMAQYFAIDIITLSIMINHIHLLLRIRPDIVRTWPDWKVARCWLWLYPKRKTAKGKPKKPNDDEVKELVRNPKRIEELRKRLSSLSWFHKRYKEKVAKVCNKADGVTGHFWEGRFGCTRMADEASTLACSVYVDLNPVRACVAQTPEESEYTGAYYRIAARQARIKSLLGELTGQEDNEQSPDSWLSPIFSDSLPADQQYAKQKKRASDTSAMGIDFDQYLELLDWTGKQTRVDKPGSIPANLDPILKRLDINGEYWVEGVKSFESCLSKIVGHPDKVQEYVEQTERQWTKGAKHCEKMFQRPGSS